MKLYIYGYRFDGFDIKGVNKKGIVYEIDVKIQNGATLKAP